MKASRRIDSKSHGFFGKVVLGDYEEDDNRNNLATRGCIICDQKLQIGEFCMELPNRVLGPKGKQYISSLYAHMFCFEELAFAVKNDRHKLVSDIKALKI